MNRAEPLLRTNISDSSGIAGIDLVQIDGLLDFAYRSRRKKAACMDLLIAGDAEMRRMNRRHLGRDNPTDVLAFEDGEEEDGRLRLGDVAINAEMAVVVAGERGVDFGHELAFYALHGLFHLLGMVDDSDEERLAMLREQAKAMRGFGLNPRENMDTL